ncbi:hypothetical protein [Lederbergia citrea]|uniref:Uncharacterized protein n=1 Tax=Lederbergia citrea TaxID=2833581 RepID=A0A942Z2U1_9BACI|nr:hypothetical protein [Lederbergia citrea]MBS4221834.1 hypothetical protein [Lederbergia citrea]
MSDNKILLYLASILAGFAILRLTLIGATAAILGVLVSVLQIIAVIVIVLFAGAIILKGLISLLRRFIK